ncbi:MAG TPA: ATP-binding protein [Candidatus Kapabacteria bacterium]|nr:ATP-binding protein [Candidatus Kapabacteria bacterium]
MKFYDRVKELDIISKANRIAVMGRRRIGKTRLLEESMPEDFIYLFFYTDASESFIVEKWTAAIKEKGIYIPPLTKITDILEYIFQKIEQPVVIDEIQNSVKKYPEFISLLQQLMDRFKQKKVAVTGSLISMMKKVVEDYKSPVFGRFDFIIKLNELDLETVLQIMTDLGYSLEEALKYYAVFGGIPKYYELIETMKPVDFNEFISLMFFRYPRPLFSEIYMMLKEEIGKEFSNYFGILHAIARKGVTFGTIASAMNMQANSISKYIDTLLNDYELIRKEQPASKKMKKTHYYIDSNIIDFWFTYCYDNLEQLDRGNESKVVERFLNHFSTFYGWKFERMVIKLLPVFLKKKGITYNSIEKDWGNDYEFDFIVESDRKLYIGEVKTGELNISTEIKQIENVIKKEMYYQGKEIGYIFIGNKFSRQVQGENIICINIHDYFAGL